MPRASDSDDVDELITRLPESLQSAVRTHPRDALLELILDLGRPPEARLTDRTVRLADAQVDRALIDAVLSRLGPFDEGNRSGIERTLHRISALKNRRGEVVGLTLRVGRAIFGTIDMIRDLAESGLNVLLLGRPGVGKTTKLRELARVLADDLGRRVMVVDTSNEIAGDGDVPHPGIGLARRMQVPRPDLQHAVMIEAVENHTPEVIVVDEIGTEQEADAARTIAERGVQLIGTAHGNTLENLVLNPTLSDLVGGIETVTLSDEEARRRRTSKTVNERRAPPTFDIVVELVSRDEVLVHRSVADAVDRLLSGQDVGGERRRLEGGEVKVEAPESAVELPISATAPRPEVLSRHGPTRIHAYALSPELLARVLRDLPIRARIAETPERADVILALRSRVGDARLAQAEEAGTPIHEVKRSSSAELRRVLKKIFLLVGGEDEERVREAVSETEHAIQRVLAEGIAVPLAPRAPTLRKLQHQLATRYRLESESVGSEPLRHLVLHPPSARARRAPSSRGRRRRK